MTKYMTVYFSHKGENYWGGSIRKLEKGNTERIAEMIQKAVGGGLFQVCPQTPYPEKYQDCVKVAKAQWQEKQRVGVAAYPDNLETCDTIFVGYPNWCGTMPMVMVTFLEHYDLTGKKLVPFCTNEGSGLGQSVEDLKRLCKGAVVTEGLSIRGTEAENSEEKVTAWAKQNL